jgi:hypothetical protein
MNTIDQARAFMERTKGMSREELWEAAKELPKDVQTAFWEMRKASYFVPENDVDGSRKEILSPSGMYKLVVSEFSTERGRWHYSQGLVYRKDDDQPIAVVQRNYGDFPYLFIEDHPKGAFLVCGKDYQGQTVIELATGNRRDHMSDGSDSGTGFCWVNYRFDAPSNILVVDGCFWACPWEYRFFDFTDPMSGWPQIETEDYVDVDDKWPVIEGDIVRCYVTREPDPDEDDTDEEVAKKPSRSMDVVRTFRREGLKLVALEEWVSDHEKGRRVERAEIEKKYEAWLATFKATDPLYLAQAKLAEDPALSPESWVAFGETNDGWCPHFSVKERKCWRRIVTHKGKTGATVDLEWAVETGPIKVVLYRDGNSDGHKFFEHSVDGMEQAFAFARAYAGGFPTARP